MVNALAALHGGNAGPDPLSLHADSTDATATGATALHTLYRRSIPEVSVCSQGLESSPRRARQASPPPETDPRTAAWRKIRRHNGF
jgi:hypothetical protein